MPKKRTAILWIRNDFRLHENPALTEAASFDELIPVYIWDEGNSNPWRPGEASKWWLHQTLKIFQKRLAELGSDLILLKGSPHEQLLHIAKKSGATAILWNCSYDPSESNIVKAVQKALHLKVDLQWFQGNILCSPEELCKKDGSPYLVYTPFWRNFLAKYSVTAATKSKKLPPLPKEFRAIEFCVEDLNLLSHLSWHEAFHKYWKPGEEEALKKVRNFFKKNLNKYDSYRNLPDTEGTSMLSPHFHFGEIHPQQVLRMIADEYGDLKKIRDPNIIQFMKEILWREFSYHLLQHFPKTPNQPLKEVYKDFPWKKNEKLFTAWTKGETGYPIVDAGMRQLWNTGWMHNRVRMITASFLIKHLGISWQEGAKWFWDTLVDADLANNTQGWQWTAGCGADAAPFFRIFNPIMQSEKFDPDGNYVAFWCPELKNLPPKWIYRPWQAPAKELAKACIILGVDYPHPVVDHRVARDKALWNYEWMRARQGSKARK